MKKIFKITYTSLFLSLVFGLSQAQTLDNRGAQQPFITYEAETAQTNAEKIGFGTTYYTVQSEASGRSAVKLQNNNDYVEFTLTKPANGFVFRFSIPDASGGNGINASLGFSVNSQAQNDLQLSSEYAWIYGNFPYSNNPADNKPHKFFDEKSVLLDRVYPAGTKIRLQKNSNNTAAYYIIDLMEAEEVPAALTQPANTVSITDFGAVANDANDDTGALLNAITAAKSSGKAIWIPQGEFTFTRSATINITDPNIVFRGAGMWHTILSGVGSRFMVSANNAEFHDFSIRGRVKERIDAAGQHTAIESDYHTLNMQNLKIQNIWVEHTKVGFWIHNMNNLYIAGCRVRNIYADGIHLRKGTKNSIVENNHVRNSGDDGIAMWSTEIANENNKIRFNTVMTPSLANGIAMYGGANNEITDNLIHDIVFAGGGINISTEHSPVALSGTVTVVRNTLLRCGSKGDYGVERGAIWINAPDDMWAKIAIKNNDIYNSIYQGLSFSGSRTVQELTLSENVFNGAGTYGIYIPQESRGTLINKNNKFTSCLYGELRNESQYFTIQTDGKEEPEPTNVTIRFKAPADWNQVAVYIWGTKEIAGGWPGQVLTKDADGFYSYTFDKNGINQANAIFNNNNNNHKASDIDALIGGCWQGGAVIGQDGSGVYIRAVSAVDCNGNSGAGIIKDTKEVIVYPNPASDYIYLKNHENINNVCIFSTSGKLIKKVIIENNYMDISDLQKGLYLLRIERNDGENQSLNILKN